MNIEYIVGNYPNNEVRSLVGEIVELSEHLIDNNRKMSLEEFEEHISDKYDFLTDEAIRKLHSSALFSTR